MQTHGMNSSQTPQNRRKDFFDCPVSVMYNDDEPIAKISAPQSSAKKRKSLETDVADVRKKSKPVGNNDGAPFTSTLAARHAHEKRSLAENEVEEAVKRENSNPIKLKTKVAVGSKKRGSSTAKGNPSESKQKLGEVENPGSVSNKRSRHPPKSVALMLTEGL